jgi:hypothetical protein
LTSRISLFFPNSEKQWKYLLSYLFIYLFLNVQNVDFENLIQKFVGAIKYGISDLLICGACQTLMVLGVDNPFVSKQLFGSFIYKVCVDFKLESENVCKGIVDQYLVNFI